MRKPLALLGTVLMGSVFGVVGMSGVAAAASVTPGESINLVATAYGPSLKDNYPYGPVDYYGNPLKAGDVAVDPSVIPLGTRLYVTGYSSPLLPAGGLCAVAVDTGGAIKGDRIDLYINAPDSQVSTFGIQHVKVTVVGAGATCSSKGSNSGVSNGNSGSSNTGGVSSNSNSGGSNTGTSATSTGSSSGSSVNQGSGSSTAQGGSASAGTHHWYRHHDGRYGWHRWHRWNHRR